MNLSKIAYHQGISDFIRFKKMPPYLNKQPEAEDWKRGFNKAKQYLL